MSRLILLLGLAAVARAAPASDLYQKFVYLAPGPKVEEPRSAVHEMQKPGVEIRFLLQFRFGLYAITQTGEIEAATAAILLEYNRADEPTGKQNPFVPAALQPGLNGDWTGDDASPGFWFTEAATNEKVEREVVFRFPNRGRYRVRITGLYNDSASARRVPVLTAVLELRELAKPEPEPEPAPEPQPEPPPETEVVEVVYVPPPVIVTVAPPCPFCYRKLHNFMHDRSGRHYYCSSCSGIVHYYADGRRRCSILEEGHRRDYDLVHGRAFGYRRPLRPHFRRVHQPTYRVTRKPVVLHPNRPLTSPPRVRNPNRPLTRTPSVLHPNRSSIRPPSARTPGSREPSARRPDRPGLSRPRTGRPRVGAPVRGSANPRASGRIGARRPGRGRVTLPPSRKPAVQPVRRVAPRPADRSGKSRARGAGAQPPRFRRPDARSSATRRSSGRARSPIARRPNRSFARRPAAPKPVVRKPVVRKPTLRSPVARTQPRPARRSFRRSMRLPPFNRRK